MPKTIDKHAAFSAILFAAVFIFWWLMHPEGLYYHEIFQMFLNDSDYFMEVASTPGGLADYLSEFCVQFYYYPVLGAAIVALILASITSAAFKINKEFSPQPNEFSIIYAMPALLLWYMMSNLDMMHSTLIAVLLSLLASLACSAAIRSGQTWRICASLALIPAGYFLIGPAICIALIISTACLIRHKKGPIYIAALIAATAIAMAACMRCAMHPIAEFFYGIGYQRQHDFDAAIMCAILISAAAPLISIKSLNKCGKAIIAIQLAIFAGMAALAASACSSPMFQTAKYLKWAHEDKWGDIISDAENNRPTTEQTMELVNTALALERKLAGQMFKFSQNGVSCLMPKLYNDLLSPLLNAELLYRTGLINPAIYYYFESNEGNPSHRGSSFNYMRLAECQIINNNYKVASKYLSKLKKTTFHKEKAKEYIKLINGDTTVHFPQISELKKLKLKKNRIFNEAHIDECLKDLLAENPSNYLAYEFLMAFEMLQGNIEGLEKSANLYTQAGYNEMPVNVQEALIIKWASQGGNLPPQISQDVAARFKSKQFERSTFWYYYLAKQQNSKE